MLLKTLFSIIPCFHRSIVLRLKFPVNNNIVAVIPVLLQERGRIKIDLDRLKDPDPNSILNQVKQIASCQHAKYDRTISLKAETESSRHYHPPFFFLLLIRNFSREFNFRETSHMRSFVKIKPSRIGDIILSFNVKGKSCPVRDFFTSQMCLLKRQIFEQ